MTIPQHIQALMPDRREPRYNKRLPSTNRDEAYCAAFNQAHDEWVAALPKIIAAVEEAERSRIEIELMSAEKHSHPGSDDTGLYVEWSEIKKALTPNN